MFNLTSLNLYKQGSDSQICTCYRVTIATFRRNTARKKRAKSYALTVQVIKTFIIFILSLCMCVQIFSSNIGKNLSSIILLYLIIHANLTTAPVCAPLAAPR